MHNIHTVYKRKYLYIYIYTVYYIHVSFTNIVKTVETNCPTVECNDCTGGFGGDALTDLNVLLILWSSQIIKFIGEAKSWQQPFPIWLLTSPEVTVIWPNMTCLYICIYSHCTVYCMSICLSIYHIYIYVSISALYQCVYRMRGTWTWIVSAKLDTFTLPKSPQTKIQR